MPQISNLKTLQTSILTYHRETLIPDSFPGSTRQFASVRPLAHHLEWYFSGAPKGHVKTRNWHLRYKFPCGQHFTRKSVSVYVVCEGMLDRSTAVAEGVREPFRELEDFPVTSYACTGDEDPFPFS